MTIFRWHSYDNNCTTDDNDDGIEIRNKNDDNEHRNGVDYNFNNDDGDNDQENQKIIE